MLLPLVAIVLTVTHYVYILKTILTLKNHLLLLKTVLTKDCF